MKYRKNKKANQTFEMFKGLAVGIAALTLLLTIAFSVMSQGKSQIEDLAPSNTTINESVTFTNNTFVALVTNTVAAQL